MPAGELDGSGMCIRCHYHWPSPTSAPCPFGEGLLQRRDVLWVATLPKKLPPMAHPQRIHSFLSGTDETRETDAGGSGASGAIGVCRPDVLEGMCPPGQPGPGADRPRC